MEIRNAEMDGWNRLSNFIPRMTRPRFAVEAFACYGLSNGCFVRSVKKEREREREEETMSRRIKKSCLLMARYKSGPVESGYRPATKAAEPPPPLDRWRIQNHARKIFVGGRGEADDKVNVEKYRSLSPAIDEISSALERGEDKESKFTVDALQGERRIVDGNARVKYLTIRSMNFNRRQGIIAQLVRSLNIERFFSSPVASSFSVCLLGFSFLRKR